uniref:COMM domain-containing protein n=1 Tax=Leersia perrieri TaxID=77586 RepID=A0A0D9XA42_9ORYZ
MEATPATPAAEAAALWGHKHLPLLARASSKDSVEYILQALWRTRRTGLDAADRAVVRDMLQLAADADLDPLLVCLRILIRRCVHGDIGKEEIARVFPEEVSPELQRLLTLLLQKFQPEWQEDAAKDRASASRSEATECTSNKNQDTAEQPAAGAKELQNGIRSSVVEKELKVQLTKDTLDKMFEDMYPVKEVSNSGNSNGHEEVTGGT